MDWLASFQKISKECLLQTVEPSSSPILTWKSQTSQSGSHTQVRAPTLGYTIFSNIQCLPTGKPSNSSGSIIWSTISGKLQFITNSSFYRIKGVGKKADGPLSVRPQTLSRQLQEWMFVAHGGPKIILPRRQLRQKSLKTWNKRKPPTNNLKAQVQDRRYVVYYISAICVTKYPVGKCQTSSPTALALHLRRVTGHHNQCFMSLHNTNCSYTYCILQKNEEWRSHNLNLVSRKIWIQWVSGPCNKTKIYNFF